MTDLGAQTCAVVGAGLLGLCTALQLQRMGQRVLLIDSGKPGQGASKGNAGFLATESIDPLATWSTVKSAPGLLFDKHGALALPIRHLPQSVPWMARFTMAATPWRANANRHAIASLNRHAVSAWQECLAGIGKSEMLVKSGYLLAWEHAGGMDAARRELKHLSAWNIPAEIVQGARLTEMEPALEGKLSHALHFPEAWRVQDPAWLCSALFEAFLRNRGEFLQCSVQAIAAAQRSPSLVLNGGQREFSKVVLCAGAYSAKLLEPLGMFVPLMAERGYHLSTMGSETILNRPVCSVDRRVFLSPLHSGLRIVGISELGGVDLPADSARFQTLRHHATQLIPARAGDFASANEWMGMRPTLPDSIPVIDTFAKNPSLGFAFGNQHLGLTQAALSARLVVEKMFNLPPTVDLTPFRISRFD